MSIESTFHSSLIQDDAMSVPSRQAGQDRVPVAPWWHTASVIAVLGIGSVASSHQRGLPNLNIPGISVNLSGYLTVLAEEWLLVLFIWLWLRRKGLSMATLTSQRWASWKVAFRDVGLAFGFLMVGLR